MDDKLLRNSINFLKCLSEVMPNTFPTAKSYYATKSTILQLEHRIRLPRTTKPSFRCPRCCLSFWDYPRSVTLSKRRKCSRFAKKILKKLEERKALTLYQHRQCQHIKSLYSQKICITCLNCKKVIEKPLHLKGKSTKKVFNTSTPAIKKRKKRDKYCGLLEKAVEEVKNQVKGKTAASKCNDLGTINSSSKDTSVICNVTEKNQSIQSGKNQVKENKKVPNKRKQKILGKPKMKSNVKKRKNLEPLLSVRCATNKNLLEKFLSDI